MMDTQLQTEAGFPDVSIPVPQHELHKVDTWHQTCAPATTRVHTHKHTHLQHHIHSHTHTYIHKLSLHSLDGLQLSGV